MIWPWAADAVACLHGVWLGVVVFGPLWAWGHPRFRLWHLLLLGLTILGWRYYCPLTFLEDALRAHYNPANPYAGQFLARHLRKFLSWDVDWTLVAWAVQGWGLVWGGVYAVLWARERSGPAVKKTPGR